MRKFVFIKWLAAKVRLSFFKNTIQLKLYTKYTPRSTSFQTVLNKCGNIRNVIQLSAFHFEIGVLVFLSINNLQIYSENRRNITIDFGPLLSRAPFYTPWKAQKIFAGVIKREYWEEISEQEYQKKNKEFPTWFPSKQLR